VLHAVIQKAFREFAAHRLWLDVFDDNARARHLYQSLGFVEEGVLRECIRWPDRFRSLVVMSMLEQEYRARFN
jgi:RimJ/RimL family protein N-acetyltransferase